MLAGLNFTFGYLGWYTDTQSRCPNTSNTYETAVPMTKGSWLEIK